MLKERGELKLFNNFEIRFHVLKRWKEKASYKQAKEFLKQLKKLQNFKMPFLLWVIRYVNVDCSLIAVDYYEGDGY